MIFSVCHFLLSTVDNKASAYEFSYRAVFTDVDEMIYRVALQAGAVNALEHTLPGTSRTSTKSQTMSTASSHCEVVFFSQRSESR